MIRPWLALTCVALTFIVSFYLFIHEFVSVRSYFYITLPILIGLYTLVAVVTDRNHYVPRRWLQNPLKILGKYLLWGAVAYGPVLLCRYHAFYAQFFPAALPFFEAYWMVYLYAGLPYFVLVEKFRYSPANVMADPFLRLLALVKRVWRVGPRALTRLLHARAYRHLLLMGLLRLHFTPLMVSQIYLTHVLITQAWMESTWNLAAVLAMLTSLVWSIDANNAAMGYFWESSFTKTRFKAMDPYPLHWIVTLSCYAPFVIWASTILPSMVDHAACTRHVINDQRFIVATDLIGLICLAGYVVSGTSLYFSTSNLCYKAIQTRGPYAIVRHPATVCKIAFFTVVTFKFTEAYTLLNLTAYVIWMGVYVARTYCEERFLSEFEEYRRYRRVVRYRFVPGVW